MSTTSWNQFQTACVSLVGRYEWQFTCAAIVADAAISCATLHPVTASTAKIAKKMFELFESMQESKKGVEAVVWLKRNTYGGDKTILIPNIFTAILLPFRVIDIAQTVKISNFNGVHDFFKTVPLFGRLKFAGITNVALFMLFSVFIAKTYQERQQLLLEKNGIQESLSDSEREMQASALQNMTKKILANHYSLVKKVSKLAFLVIFTTITLVGWVHPMVTVLKVCSIAIQLTCSLGKMLIA